MHRRISIPISAPEVAGWVFGDVHAATGQKPSADEADTRLRMRRKAESQRTRAPRSPSPAPPEEDARPSPSELEQRLLVLLLPPLRQLLQHGLHLPHPLYSFQPAGIEFLALREHALLADEMGLGKTIQAIVALRVLFLVGLVRQAVVVCPASLKRNWEREFVVWAPELVIEIVEGTPAERLYLWSAPVHVLVVGYETLRNDIEHLRDQSFGVVLLDEAQRIKNPEAKLSRATKELGRKRSWCLSGTPLENTLNDLASVFDFVRPDLLSFVRRDTATDSTTRERIPKCIAPHFLRRRKADVLHDLPPKVHRDLETDLTSAQRRAYRRAEEEGKAYLKELGHEVTVQHVLALLTRLKQICNFDPETGASAKLSQLEQILDETADAGDKALVFSQYSTTVEFLAPKLDRFRPLVFHGGISMRERDSVVDRFRQSPDHGVLLISLRSGGVGLNLETASHVVHFDRWWNPAVETQAEDRAHRIGQKQSLLVTRMVTLNTIEERIRDILEQKRHLFDEVIEGAPQAETMGLSPEELFRLVDLEPELARRRG